MNRALTTIPGLSSLADRLTMSTRGRFGRALIDALRGGRRMSRRQLSDAVGDASRELRSGGLDDPGVLAFLGAVVEDTGRACGADRPSLLSGQLRWMPVRARVLEVASFALAVPRAES